MRSRPTVTEVARNFSDYIDRVVDRGERFVLMRGHKPVAELSPVKRGLRLRELPGLLSALPHLSPEDSASFESDLTDVRRELDQMSPRDPWGS